MVPFSKSNDPDKLIPSKEYGNTLADEHVKRILHVDNIGDLEKIVDPSRYDRVMRLRDLLASVEDNIMYLSLSETEHNEKLLVMFNTEKEAYLKH